jgi:hypothetical protein
MNDDLTDFELWFQICSDGIELRRINYNDEDRLLYFSYNSYVGMCLKRLVLPLSREYLHRCLMKLSRLKAGLILAINIPTSPE